MKTEGLGLQRMREKMRLSEYAAKHESKAPVLEGDTHNAAQGVKHGVKLKTQKVKKGSYKRSNGYKSAHEHIKGEQGEQEQLRFYALYQQSIKGPCTKPEPPPHQSDALDKWLAHKSLGNMPKSQAQEFYYEMLQESPTCLLLDKIYEKEFVDRKLEPSFATLCAFSTDPS